MQAEIVNVFTTSIYRSYNAISDNQRSELLSLAKELSNNECKHDAVTGLSYHPMGNFLDIAEEKLPSCKNIKNQLLIHINAAAEVYGLNPELTVDNSWFNIQQKNTRLKRHTHENSIMSCVIYLSVNNNTSKLTFSNPNPYVHYFTRTQSNNPNNSVFWEEAPINKMMLVFPSYLAHETEVTNLEDEDRIVLSINANY